MKKAKKKAYMCSTDFTTELGYTKIMLYSSVEELKDSRSCWEQCGIVEVTVSFSKEVLARKPFSKRGQNE